MRIRGSNDYFRDTGTAGASTFPAQISLFSDWLNKGARGILNCQWGTFQHKNDVKQKWISV